MSGIKAIFHRKTPEEEAKEWTRKMRSEQRKIDLQINKIQREQQKVKVAMKQAAKKDDPIAVRMLAKELVQSKHAISRMYTAKAQMNSVSMQLQNQMSQMKLAGSMKQSAEIMKEMNDLVKVKEVRQSMMEMGKEMSKAGLIEEMMNDAVDSALGEISDGELDEEVSKVVDEVTQTQMQGAYVGAKRLPQKQQQVQQEEEEEDAEDAELAAKLAALKGGA